MTLAKGARQLVVHDALLGVKKKKCHRSQEVKLKLVKCSLEELTISSCASVCMSRYSVSTRGSLESTKEA